MLTTNGAMIKNDIIKAFDTAVANPENINNTGGINWNFVDADMYVDLSSVYASTYIDECIEVLVDNYFDKAA